MSRLMDTVFKGFVYLLRTMFIKRNGNIVFQDKESSNRVMLRFNVDNKLYIQRIDDNLNILSNFISFDCDKNITSISGVSIANSSNPVAIKGGLYFNDQNNKWYKCEDGENWVLANI